MQLRVENACFDDLSLNRQMRLARVIKCMYRGADGAGARALEFFSRRNKSTASVLQTRCEHSLVADSRESCCSNDSDDRVDPAIVTHTRKERDSNLER